MDTIIEIDEDGKVHANPLLVLDIKEILALCRILEREYINYEDREAHMVVNKLFECKRNYERDLARTTNKD